MRSLARGVRVMAIVVGVFAMQGCFTPVHMEGIEFATALRREFGSRAPSLMWSFGCRLVSVRIAPVRGEWGGAVERDGALFDEYRFASVLVSSDGRRCLRILIPAGGMTGDRVALLEEFEGEVRGESPAWLYLYPSANGGRAFIIEEPGEPGVPGIPRVPAERPAGDRLGQGDIPPDGRIIRLDVDALFVTFARGLRDESPVKFAVEDRTEWRERSGLEALARVVTIPVAMVGDAGLIVGVVVGLPAWGIVHQFGEVARGIGRLFSDG